MRDRSPAPASRARRHLVVVDVALLTPHRRTLAVMLRRAAARKGGRDRWELPWSLLAGGEPLDAVAARLARATLGAAPAHLEQAGTVSDGRRHPGGESVSIGYLGLAPAGTQPPVRGAAAWFPIGELPALAARQRQILERALATLRARFADASLAFRLLPATFTLTQLQEIHEVVLGRRLHKASFRRSITAAGLVEPIAEWRSEGRGRPAQLFRYSGARTTRT